MLERGQNPELHDRRGSDTQIIDLDHILDVFLRQWRVLAICVGIGVLLGVVYLALAPRSYFAQSQILIGQDLQNLKPTDSTSQNTSAQLESEVLNQSEVIRSSRIARAVVDAEHLDTDPEFLNPPPSFMGRLGDLLFGFIGHQRKPPVTSVPPEYATLLVMNGVAVDRVGRSSVLGVGYSAYTPELALRIATAYADAFVRDQLNTGNSKAAADWLQQQLTQLGESRRAASDAVDQYRKQSGHSVSQDQTLSDQRLQALTSQLVIAQSETARVRALSTQLQAAVAAGPTQAGLNAGLLNSSLLDQNRSQDPKADNLADDYAAIVRRLGEVTAAFGPDHPQVAELNREKIALSSQIFAQLQQLKEQYTNELSVAQGRESAIRQDVQDEGNQSSDANQSQVKLNELQQKATALEELYNSFLQRYEQVAQQQSFPIPSVRIITDATRPLGASSPRTIFTLIGAALFGGFLGLCFAALNELRERSFRLGNQIGRELGLRFIGYLPNLRLRPQEKKKGISDERSPGQLRDVIRGQVLGVRPGTPVAAFAETLKATRILLDARRHHGRGMVVGSVSVLPGEGKTTFSVAFSEMLAAGGSRVLLIDGDLRHPAASRLVAPGASGGLLDVAAGTPWRELLQVDRETGLALLPGVASPDQTSAADPMMPSVMNGLLEEAREIFDYIIIDLPPLGPMVDALSILPLTEGCILVTEWGHTPKRLVRSMIEREPQLAESVIGVVLNKVNFDKLARYSGIGETERYIGAYSRYYEVAQGPKR